MDSTKIKLIKAITSTALVVGGLSFAVVNFVSSNSFGWFSKNKVTETSGAKTKAYYNGFDMDHRIYKIETNNFKGTDTDEEGEFYQLDNFTFLSFDTIFRNQNVHTPVTLRLMLSGENMSREGSVKITFSRDMLQPSELTQLDEYFTSVMNFACGIDPYIYELNHGDYDPDLIYQNAYDTFTSTRTPYTPKSFVTVNSETSFTKAEDVTFTVDYTSRDWNDDILNVYVFMTYNESLINYYFNGGAGTIKSLDDTHVNFNNDISKVTIAVLQGATE